MKTTQPTVLSRAGCTRLAAVAALLWVPMAAQAADPGPSKPAAKSSAVTLLPVAGSNVKRVVLSARAAERLGIETGTVREEPIVFRQMVSGLVVAPVEKPPVPKPGGGTFGGFAQTAGAPAMGLPAGGAGPAAGVAKVAVVAAAPAEAPASGGPASGAAKLMTASDTQPSPATAPPRANAPLVGDAWVLVSVSPAEWERLAKDKPARLLPLPTRDRPQGELLARPSGMVPVEDAKRSMLSLHYIVAGADHGLALNSRLRVELQVAGDEARRKVVPYGAVYYDGKGAPWVYVVAGPLSYERRRVGVERVVGDLAVLSNGPEAGTPLVTVGASLLYGAEIFGK